MAILHLNTTHKKEDNAPITVSEYIASLKNKEAFLTDRTTKAPKVLWHGSASSFKEFNLSRAGENTGLVEYTDRKTGEKVTSDSSKAIFFTDNREAAISYAFLARTNRLAYLKDCLIDIRTYLRNNDGAPEYLIDRIHTPDDLHTAFDKLREEKDSEINGVLDSIDLSRERPITSLEQNVKEQLVERLNRIINRYREYERLNSRGGLSNQLNNFTRMKEYIPYFESNIERLRNNDPTVRTEFGKDFTEYNQSFYSKDGNSLFCARYDQEQGRMYLNNEPMDRMSDRRTAELLAEIRFNLNENISQFNRDIKEAGFLEHTFLYPVLLKSASPFAHDYKGSAFPDKYLPNPKYSTAYIAARQTAHALNSDHDCVIYENIRDPFDQTNYGVFRAEQIQFIPQNVTGLNRTPVLERMEQPEPRMKRTKEHPYKLSM